MQGIFRVAFASHDRNHVDQHFGAAEGFVIYELNAERAQLAGVVEFPREDMDGNENKLAARIDALGGCAAVYCLAVGGSAVRQLIAAGVQPVRLEACEPIEPILAALRCAIREGGVPWVDRALKQAPDARRFDQMAEEGWQE